MGVDPGRGDAHTPPPLQRRWGDGLCNHPPRLEINDSGDNLDQFSGNYLFVCTYR